jgi:hypothetical protein
MLALTQPYYAPEYNLLSAFHKRRQQFRFDVFVFLSMALSSLHANLDLPMACLWKAKESLGQRWLLSDQIRYAVAYQSILVDYGQWSNANTLFQHWYSCIPASSRLFRELVLVHVKGVFYQIEDLSAEIWITRINHNKCTNLCFERYITPSLALIEEKIQNVKNIAHVCLAIYDVGCDFESELELILDVCTIYSLTLKQMTFDAILVSAQSDQLATLWQHMQWHSPGHTVHHLKPFVNQLPYSTNGSYYWKLQIDQTLIELRQRLSESTHVVTSRILADCFFSIGGCMVWHAFEDELNICALTESLQEYERCTHHRHYRISLLKRLINVIKEPRDYHLPEEVGCRHRKVPLRDKTFIGFSKDTIHQFCSTLDDATSNFATLNATNDETFISYLKQKDQNMPMWISVGQQAFQFASDI